MPLNAPGTLSLSLGLSKYVAQQQQHDDSNNNNKGHDNVSKLVT